MLVHKEIIDDYEFQVEDTEEGDRECLICHITWNGNLIGYTKSYTGHIRGSVESCKKFIEIHKDYVN